MEEHGTQDTRYKNVSLAHFTIEILDTGFGAFRPIKGLTNTARLCVFRSKLLGVEAPIHQSRALSTSFIYLVLTCSRELSNLTLYGIWSGVLVAR